MTTVKSERMSLPPGGKDLTIRPLGRAQITEDSAAGFNKIVRKYVVLGYRASKASIDDTTNPLFPALGAPDEEFTDYYLTNQRVEPVATTTEKAYLIREFVDIRDVWSGESISESGELKKITRRFAVLRAQHAKGYDSSSWANHPHKSSGDRKDDPWDYLPTVIKNSEPTEVSYSDDGSQASGMFSNAANKPSDLAAPKVNVGAAVIDNCLPVGVDQDEATVTISTGAGGTGAAVKIQLIAGGLGVPAAGEIHVKIGGSDADTRNNIKDAVNGTTNTAVAVYGSGSSNTDGIAGVVADNGSGTNTVKLTTSNMGSTASITIGGVSGTWAPVAQTVSGTDPTLVTALATATSTDNLSVKWVRASAQVDISNPGLDLWSVSWVAPISDHWASGAKSSGGKGGSLPTMVDFDFNGIRILKFGSTSVTGGPRVIHTYTSYVVGDSPGATVSSYFGANSSIQPAVSMDFQITGQSSAGSQSFTSKLSNAFMLQNTENYLRFPNWYGDIDQASSGVAVARKHAFRYEFKYNNLDFTSGFAAHPAEGTNLCHYKYLPIIHAGGNISWSHTYILGATYSQLVGASITPIFSHNDERIWRISLAFAS